MSLRILFHGEGPFHNGSTTSGHVELAIKSAAQQASVTTVNLAFSCRCKTSITRVTGTGNNRRTHYYSSKAVLFSHSYVLENGDFQISSSRRGEDGGILSFPFELLIPTHAEGITPEKLQLHEADLFPPEGVWPGSAAYFDTVPSGQPLPDHLPNFRHIGTAYRTDLDGSITYKVRAEVPNMSANWKSLWIGKMDEDVCIPVINPNSSLGAASLPGQYRSLSTTTEVRTLRLLPTHADGHLSFRERTKSIFKKSALPSLGLKLTFSAPQTLFLDAEDSQVLPFLLRISHIDSTGDTAAGDSTSIGQKAGDLDRKHPFPPTTSVSPSNPKSISDTNPADDSPHVPTPKILLSRLTLYLVAHSQVRSNPASRLRLYMDPGYAESYQEYELFEFKHREKDRSIEIPVMEDDDTPCPDSDFNYTAAGTSSSTNSPAWSLGEKVNLTHAHLKTLVEKGVVGPTFATPNLARSYHLQWDIRLEVAGEEVRWRSARGGIGGVGEDAVLGVLVTRGGGGGGIGDLGMDGIGTDTPGASNRGSGGARVAGRVPGDEEQLPRYAEGRTAPSYRPVDGGVAETEGQGGASGISGHRWRSEMR